MDQKFKQDKGVAGLTVLLSLIVMLFIIGLIVMIFTLMGTELRDATYTSTSAVSTNESLTPANETGVTLTIGSALRSGSCGAVTVILNQTNNYEIALANITQIGCVVYNTTTTSYSGSTTSWRYTYPYTYDADNDATNVMNDTTVKLASVSDWFGIFIVIGAMVVLILLTVIIITAIRGSGMIAGAESQNGANSVGTA